MKNKNIRRNLKVISVSILVLSISFLIGGVILNRMLQKVRVDTIKQELINQTTLYESQMQRKIDDNLQTLNTLQSFIEFDQGQSLLERFNEANENNHFTQMSLFYQDGSVYHATLNEKIIIENFSTLDPHLQSAIQSSWEGKNTVSEVFYDTSLRSNVTVISIPVYKADNIIGILAAYETIDEFKDILRVTYNEKIVTHLISNDGQILASTQSHYEQEDLEFLHTTYWNQDETLLALENAQEFFDTVKKDGHTYGIYVNVIEPHQWYLLNVISLDHLGSPIVNLVQTSSFFYGIIILVYFILLFSFFKTMKKNDEFLEKQVYFDELTGALKLSRFKEKVGEELKNGQLGSMAIMNVKNFHFINQTFGEDYGDNLLKGIVSCIQEALHSGEYCSRDTSDQFVIFLLEEDTMMIEKRLQHIKNKIKQRFSMNQFDYDIQLHVGVCTKQDDPLKMYHNGLWALKHARHVNEKIIFFDDQLMKSIQIQNEIEYSMHQALKNGEFKLFLQPKYDLIENKIAGAEALVRWIRDDGSMFFPDQFIPLFEKNGFCVDLDLYMLEAVCKKLRKWIDAGKEVYPISVNQTKLLFYQVDYIDKLKTILDKYQISPKLIILEVLEGLAVENLESFNRCIEKLHENGFIISLDDFGSGYSSLSNLNELKVDEIKIDHKFTMQLTDNDEGKQNQIFKQILSLVSTLDAQVVVEGVENKHHVEILKSMHCRFGQGYYFSKPIPDHEYEKYFI